jgi:hypothetical protein
MTRTPQRTYKSAQQRRLDALAALDDPSRLTVSISQAAFLIGIAVSTALNAARTTGRLLDNVPVHRVQGTRRARFVVRKDDLRAWQQRTSSRPISDDNALSTL